LIAGKKDESKSLSQQALVQGAPVKEFLYNALLAGMDEVGQQFKAGLMFTLEVLVCACCMHATMDILKPLLSDGNPA